jgi:hypothetical protein
MPGRLLALRDQQEDVVENTGTKSGAMDFGMSQKFEVETGEIFSCHALLHWPTGTRMVG